MTERPTSGQEPGTHEESFVLDQLADRLDTLPVLRESDPERADAMLERFGASGQVEAELLGELSQRQPLKIPDRLPEAHRAAMRAIEVFDRNAGRPPTSLRAGPGSRVASSTA